jgi:hypothetical protein
MPPAVPRAAGGKLPDMAMREALAGEMTAVGAPRVGAYRPQGPLAANPRYAAPLAALGADGHGTVLAADGGGELPGAVMLERRHARSEAARGPGEQLVPAAGAGAAGVRAAAARAALGPARGAVAQ